MVKINIKIGFKLCFALSTWHHDVWLEHRNYQVISGHQTILGHEHCKPPTQVREILEVVKNLSEMEKLLSIFYKTRDETCGESKRERRSCRPSGTRSPAWPRSSPWCWPCWGSICCCWGDTRLRPACAWCSLWRDTPWESCEPHTGRSTARWRSSDCKSRAYTPPAGLRLGLNTTSDRREREDLLPLSSIQNCLRCSYFQTPSSWVSGAVRMWSTSAMFSLLRCSCSQWLPTLRIFPDGLLNVLLYCQGRVHLIERFLWPRTEVGSFSSWQIPPDDGVGSISHLSYHFLSETE